MALPPPFPIRAHDDTLIWNGQLMKRLEPLEKKFKQIGVAVADMTNRATGGIGGMSSYAGWNVDTTRFSASLLKIGVLFAAYQLRENLNIAIQGLAVKNVEMVLPTVENAWRPLVQNKVLGEWNFPTPVRRDGCSLGF